LCFCLGIWLGASLDLWTIFGFCGSLVSLTTSFHDLSFVSRPFSQLQWELSTIFSHTFISISVPIRERECWNTVYPGVMWCAPWSTGYLHRYPSSSFVYSHFVYTFIHRLGSTFVYLQHHPYMCMLVFFCLVTGDTKRGLLLGAGYLGSDHALDGRLIYIIEGELHMERGTHFQTYSPRVSLSRMREKALSTRYRYLALT
jgi:hypothetical protein